MKVKCIRLLDHSGKEVQSSPWLRVGAVYHVLSIEIGTDGVALFRIMTSEKLGEWPMVGLHQASCFEVVTTHVPSNWSVTVGKPFHLDIAPTAWQTETFLEDFYNHEPYTYEVFMHEREIIEIEDT